ncbi:MAG: hypothetical protein AB7S44_01755 [Spirochaetales bacterium]
MVDDKMEKRESSQVKITPQSRVALKSNVSLLISLTLILVVGIISVSYAWVFSTEFSDITGVNIVLGESQGLVMTVNGNVSESININNYLGASFSTFSLKEASSSDGRDLFLRDSGTYYVDEENIYEGIDVASDEIGIIQFRDADLSDRNVSFIYFDLTLESTGDNRYLIFDDTNSYIKDISNNLINPVRVSLTFVEGESTTTKIIGNRQEYYGNYYTEAVSNIDSITKVGYTTDQDVETFAGYNGYEDSVFSASHTLYYLTNGVQIHVVVRIWLEGGDPLCTNSIAGSLLNIALQFDNIAESEVI